jgi:ATP-binding cassette subfamily B protein
MPLASLLPYFRRYRVPVALGLACVILGNVFQLAGPQFLRRGIDAVTAGVGMERILLLALGLLAAAVLTGVVRYVMRIQLNGVSRRVEYDLRNDLYAHLQRLDTAFYQRTPTGDLMALSTNDLAAVRMVAGPAIMYAVETTTRIAMALPLMVGIDARLTLFVLIPMLGVPAVIIVMGPILERRFAAVQEHFATLTTAAQENLAGVRVVRAYRQEAAQLARFRDLSDAYIRRNMLLARSWGLLFPLITLIAGGALALTLWVGGGLVMRGTVTLGDYVAFATYLVMLSWPMIGLGWVVNLVQRGSASMARIRRIMDEVPVIADPAEPRTLPDGGRARGLEFRGVGFRYPSRRPGDGEGRGWALRDISFTVPAGSWAAIVGATGAGKSTLAHLIPRLTDPTEGTVLLDGVPLRALRLADLRAVVGFVPQDTFLFSQTIAENIGLGAVEEPAIEAAARVAQFDSTVRGFPDGYATMLGERGINLSGGQKQRAAIARALARDPGLVVLDDALSAVDTETEAALLRELRRELAGRTAVVISHRVTAVRDADLIVVLDDGRMVETGRHEELVEKRGRYWQLLRRQLVEEEIELGLGNRDAGP